MRLPSRPWLLHYCKMLAVIGGGLALILTIVWLVQRRSPSSQPAQVPTAPFRFADGSDQPFPGNRFVALYGTPGDPVLGVLGEQEPAAAVKRVKALAAEYAPLTRERVMPAFEIISTIAASEATANGDYSRELEPAVLHPWIDEARKAGVYVILDLQPGSTAFDEQAKQYAGLLRQPHVGLALDPEWRLQPGKQHLEDIGSVSAEEVNRTSAWLDQLVRDHKLPQKLFLLHQFRGTMLPDRDTIRSRPGLASVIQMDGQGATELKQQTYDAITAQPPSGVRFGWKNFYAKDTPVLTPVETMRQQPVPWLIPYQ